MARSCCLVPADGGNAVSLGPTMWWVWFGGWPGIRSGEEDGRMRFVFLVPHGFDAVAKLSS